MSNFYSNYTPTNTYSVSDFIVLIYENLGKARKRGGGYVLGIKYYDDLGRYCSVVEINKLYIPFINEDLGKYLPNYPIGTYKYGKPIISFQINSDAPSWAKYYRFLWTKNINTIKILQWFINDVKYITQYDELDNTFVETTFQNKNATSVLLNIGNIVNYRNQNPLSNVGYSFDSGDRIRLISKRDNSKYEYTDLRVVSYKPTGYLQVEINSSIQEISYFQIYKNTLENCFKNNFNSKHGKN